MVSDDDIALMRAKLIAGVSGDNKKMIVKKEFHDEDGFLLPLPDKIIMSNMEFSYNATSGDKVETLE